MKRQNGMTWNENTFRSLCVCSTSKDKQQSIVTTKLITMDLWHALTTWNGHWCFNLLQNRLVNASNQQFSIVICSKSSKIKKIKTFNEVNGGSTAFENIYQTGTKKKSVIQLLFVQHRSICVHPLEVIPSSIWICVEFGFEYRISISFCVGIGVFLLLLFVYQTRGCFSPLSQ